jgi:hypothetical protein
MRFCVLNVRTLLYVRPVGEGNHIAYLLIT